MAVQFTRGTPAEWAAATVILADGQLGIQVNGDGTFELRAGDGINLWPDLDVLTVLGGGGGGGGGGLPPGGITNSEVSSGAGIALSKTADDTSGGGRLALVNAERTKLNNVPTDTNASLSTINNSLSTLATSLASNDSELAALNDELILLSTNQPDVVRAIIRAVIQPGPGISAVPSEDGLTMTISSSVPRVLYGGTPAFLAGAL